MVFHLIGHGTQFSFFLLFLSFLPTCILSGLLSSSLSQDAVSWHTDRWLGSFTEHSVSIFWCWTLAVARQGDSVVTEISLPVSGAHGQRWWWAHGKRVEGRCDTDNPEKAAGESCVGRAGVGWGAYGSTCVAWTGSKMSPQKRECLNTPELLNPHNVEKHDGLTTHLTSS